MGEPRRPGRPENCKTGAGEGSTGIHCGRARVRAGWPGGCGCYCSSCGTGRPRGIAEMLISNHTGADCPIPTEMEILIERLLSGAPATKPTLPPQTGITGMETLLQCLLPGMPVSAVSTVMVDVTPEPVDSPVPDGLAGNVTVGVKSPAELAGGVTVGVSSPTDLAGGVTVGVAPSAVAGVASPADIAEILGWHHRRCDVLGRCWGGVLGQHCWGGVLGRTC